MITLNINKWILLIAMAIFVAIILPKWKTKLSIEILMSPSTSKDFQLFYKTSPTSKFTGARIINSSTTIINSELVLIEFAIPDSVVFSRIRIDLGETQNIHYINKISLKGFLNKFVWFPEQIITDYRPINVKILQEGGQLKMIPITNDPYIISKVDLDKLAWKIRFKSKLFSNSYFIFFVIVTGILIFLWIASYLQFTVKELLSLFHDK